MTRSEVTSLCLKLAALFVWVEAFGAATFLGMYVWAMNEGGGGGKFELAKGVVPVILLIGLGALLYFLSSRIEASTTQGTAPANFEDRGEVGAIGLRIAAIMLWLEAIGATQHALFLIRFAQGSGHWGGFFTQAAVCVVLAAVGVWLFHRANPLAQRWFASRITVADPGTLATVQAVAFSVLGLWILADVAPKLAAFATVAFGGQESEEVLGSMGLKQDWREALGQFVRAALGLYLFFGGNGLSGLWHRIRTAGVATQRAAT